jgi:hypothetical protein
LYSELPNQRVWKEGFFIYYMKNESVVKTFLICYMKNLKYGERKIQKSSFIREFRVGGQIFQETIRCAGSLSRVFRKFPLKLDANRRPNFVDMKI